MFTLEYPQKEDPKMTDYEALADSYDREPYEGYAEAAMEDERSEYAFYCPECDAMRVAQDDAFQDYARSAWVCDPCGGVVALI
jgi:hypothetical protein